MPCPEGVLFILGCFREWKDTDFISDGQDDHLVFFCLKKKKKKNSWNKIKLMVHRLILREHDIFHYKSMDKNRNTFAKILYRHHRKTKL